MTILGRHFTVRCVPLCFLMEAFVGEEEPEYAFENL